MKTFLYIAFALLACHASSAAERPNILLIFADDIGYEALNCYGGQDFETPNLNRMAEQGVRFSRAYTSPVCTPSRVSLHTGLYVNRHGHDSVLPVHGGTRKKVDFEKMPTFAQQIRANGYLTSATGKWQLATLQHHPNHIREAGFDSWCAWQIWRDGGKTDRHWNPTFNQNGEIRDDIADRFGPDVLVDYVIAQMRTAKANGKPFLIVHNELLPHWPIVETPDDRKLKRKPSLAHFIHYMDKLVGRLLDEVEALGIRENTYVVFMGDNGTWEPDFKNPKSGQPGERPHTRHTTAGKVNGGKNQLNDGGSHVPLLVWGPPFVPAGKVCGDLVDVVDLFPTFCELTGTEIPSSIAIDGRSIVPQIHGKSGVPRPWTHNALSKKFGGETLFDGSFRLFRNNGKLIDARALPLEKTADPSDPEAAVAKAKLRAVFESISPDGPRPPVPFINAAE
ncbi:sulfatase-like hydrolase/transferase [Haloferula sp.]|uniref:sulfatase-like hydrolase/transferase n=1 Tax=Haloferula sp. TaxID=2497595 RepID=UPI003C782CE5